MKKQKRMYRDNLPNRAAYRHKRAKLAIAVRPNGPAARLVRAGAFNNPGNT